MATKTKSPRKATGKKRSFHQELVLNRWVLGFFQGGTLDAFFKPATTKAQVRLQTAKA